jgi:hypothetical protein
VTASAPSFPKFQTNAILESAAPSLSRYQSRKLSINWTPLDGHLHLYLVAVAVTSAILTTMAVTNDASR